MARGYPDFASSSDKREVSIRPSLAYGSGTALFSDDFNSPTLRWIDLGASDEEISIKTYRPFSGDSCLYMKNKSTSTYFVAAYVKIAEALSGKIGYEARVKFPLTGVSSLKLYLTTFSGSRRVDFGIQYDFSAGVWKYLTTGFTYTATPTTMPSPVVDITTWHHIKLVGDITAEKYVYVIIDGKTYALDTLVPYAANSTTNAHTILYLNFASLDATQLDFYVDEVVLTQEA